MGNLLEYKGTVEVRPTWITDSHIVDRQSEGSAKIVVGVTGAKTVAGTFKDYEDRRLCPHATYDAETDTMYQHIPLDKRALIVADHLPKSPASISTSYWILVVGLEAHPLGEEKLAAIAKMLKAVSKELEVDLQFGEFPSQGVAVHNRVIRYENWGKTSGIVSITATPDCQFASLGPEEAFEIEALLKLKKKTVVPTPDEIEIVKPKPKAKPKPKPKAKPKAKPKEEPKEEKSVEDSLAEMVESKKEDTDESAE